MREGGKKGREEVRKEGRKESSIRGQLVAQVSWYGGTCSCYAASAAAVLLLPFVFVSRGYWYIHGLCTACTSRVRTDTANAA